MRHNIICEETRPYVTISFEDWNKLMEIVKTLKWYADKENWISAHQMDVSACEYDGGDKAREALKLLEGEN